MHGCKLRKYVTDKISIPSNLKWTDFILSDIIVFVSTISNIRGVWNDKIQVVKYA